MSSTAPTPFQLRIEGMHCGGCVRRVKAALTRLEGVAVADVVVGEARGTLDPDLAAQADLEAAIAELGFTVRPDPSGP
jgi:copper chaperone